jgi:transcriptional regulator with XRE-family HTH domain
MFNIAAAANLAELGRRIRTARTKLHWSQEAFAGVCGLERSYYGGVERGKRNVTFKVLCLSCDGLACDVATITQGLPHLIQAVPGSIGKWRPATARMLGRRSMKIKRLGNAYCAVRLGTPPGELLPVSGTTFTAYLH